MAFRNLHIGLVALLAGSLLAPLPARAATTVNRPPVISGSPPTSVAAGVEYSFRPVASDPDRRTRLRFSITNKPGWASFSTRTGSLRGTPTMAQTGTTSGIVIRVSDGLLSAELPAFSITVTGAAPANRPPVVSGIPPTSATVGVAYSFTPAGSDPDGDGLTWSITGKPTNAGFSVATGQLSWTPAAPGTWSNIVITATDSRGAATSLPSFAISVQAAPASGTATLSWQAPTQYTDGGPLPPSELDAYRIYSGSTSTSLSPIAEVDSGTLIFTVQPLATGVHYFAVTAVTTAGVESPLSAVGSKTIP